MKIKLFLIISSVVMFSLSGHSQTQSLIQTYKGTIPCTNCAGIEYNLTLTKIFPAADGTFDLTMRYLAEKGTASKAQYSGRYYVLRGSKEDINATVYELRSDKLDGSIFLLVSGNNLKILDSEQAEIQSPNNYTLFFQRAKVKQFKN